MRFSYLSLISYELSNVRDKHKEFEFFIFSSEVTDSYCTDKICDLESHDQASLSAGCKKAAAILKETDRQMS